MGVYCVLVAASQSLSLRHYKAVTASIPSLQRRELRLGGVKWFAPLVSSSAWIPAQVCPTPKP